MLFSAITIETHLLTGHWWGKGEPIYIVTAPPMPGEAGQVSDVQFSDISSEAESGIVLSGSPAAPIRDVSFDNVSFKIRTTRKDVSRAVGGNFDFRWTAKDRSHALFKHSIPGAILPLRRRGKHPGLYAQVGRGQTGLLQQRY